MNKYRCTPLQRCAIQPGVLSYMARGQSRVWIYSLTGLLWRTCLRQHDEERQALSLRWNAGLNVQLGDECDAPELLVLAWCI